MQFKFFTVPAGGADISSFEDELNHFMRAHRVLSVQKEFSSDGMRSCWCICIEYMDSSATQEHAGWQAKERVDYREILSEEAFSRFAVMRSLRKVIAENDHVPAYAIMKDDQLAELAKLPAVDEKALKALPGFGEKKYEKYGQRLLALLCENKGKDETGGQSVPSNQ